MKLCVVEGCEKLAYARNWCQRHYYRWQENGDPGGLIRSYARQAPVCVFDGCEKKAKARGWCAMHYKRWSVHGDPAVTIAVRYDPVCSIEGCVRPHDSHGWCNLHWRRNRDYGDPMAGPPPAKHSRKHPSHEAGTCICSKCDVEQPLENFIPTVGKSSGHRSHCRSCEAKWRAEHRDTAYEPSRRRRAAIRGGLSDKGISNVALRARLGDCCAYCGIVLDFGSYGKDYQPSNYATVDHVIPVSRGGSHTWDNVVLACQACNCAKRDSVRWAESKRR